MNRNPGRIDRVARIVVGFALLSLAFVGPHPWFGLVGLIPLVTGLVELCPLYRLVGLRTCPVQR